MVEYFELQRFYSIFAMKYFVPMKLLCNRYHSYSDLTKFQEPVFCEIKMLASTPNIII